MIPEWTFTQYKIWGEGREPAFSLRCIDHLKKVTFPRDVGLTVLSNKRQITILDHETVDNSIFMAPTLAKEQQD